MLSKRSRVDKLLVEQGLARSRTHGQALVMAGAVCLGDYLVKKPSEEFPSESQFRLKDGAASKYVSRGGDKMEGALKASGINVKDYRVLDVGISTGGFTDCLLQNGAREVVGLDVGHNQLDWKLKSDARVKSFEGINARAIPADIVGEPCDLVVIDVSFISLTLVLPEAMKYLKRGGYLLALIKPQFEVRREDVGKRGIVKDPLLHGQVQDKIIEFCKQDVWALADLKIFESPIEGTDGNKEFFIFARRG